MSRAALAVPRSPSEGNRLLEKTVLIVNAVGLHARPASLIAQTASRFASDVMLRHGNYEANGKSIMGLLGLAAAHGAEVVIRVAGSDEEQALAALESLFASGFGEP
jgi:phosphotransferase system HPr (HPr) family protein